MLYPKEDKVRLKIKLDSLINIIYVKFQLFCVNFLQFMNFFQLFIHRIFFSTGE